MGDFNYLEIDWSNGTVGTVKEQKSINLLQDFIFYRILLGMAVWHQHAKLLPKCFVRMHVIRGSIYIVDILYICRWTPDDVHVHETCREELCMLTPCHHVLVWDWRLLL